MSEQQHALELILDLDAPREKLWRCWTEPKLLEKWFCPKPWYVTDARIDLRPGGEFSVACMAQTARNSQIPVSFWKSFQTNVWSPPTHSIPLETNRPPLHGG